LIARGIVHCHSNLSYDGSASLQDLRACLREGGFDFVALTDHDRGVSPEKYRQLVEACRAISDDRFVAVPGIEVLCTDGVEIAGIGVHELPTPGDPETVVRQIRAARGYAIWVHPLKRSRSRQVGRVLDCDAVEVLNGKVDGTLAPDLRLVRRVQRERRRGRPVHLVFGLDLHDLDQPRDVWVECDVESLQSRAIIDALRHGRFVNRVRRGSMTSTGLISIKDRSLFALLRLGSVIWDTTLKRSPVGLRGLLVRSSRWAVARLKGSKPLC
jgi:hypothetical protein